jgi:hypothetical protein
VNFIRSPYPRTLVWSGGPATTALLVVTSAHHDSAEQAKAELDALGLTTAEIHVYDTPTPITWEFSGHKHEDSVYLFALVRDDHAQATAVHDVANRLHRERFPAGQLDALEQQMAAHFLEHPDHEARQAFEAAARKCRKAINHVRDNVATRHHHHHEQHKVKGAFDAVKTAHAEVHAAKARVLP